MVAALAPPRGQLPSTATLRRALRRVDSTAMEARLAHTAVGAAPAPVLRRLAFDGKAVRGANRHGAAVHLVSFVEKAKAAEAGI